MDRPKHILRAENVRIGPERRKALILNTALSYADIAYACERKVSTVVTWAARLHLLYLRGRGQPSAKFQPSDLVRIREMRRAGKPMTEIARATGLSLGTIQHLQCRHGIQRLPDEPKPKPKPRTKRTSFSKGTPC